MPRPCRETGREQKQNGDREQLEILEGYVEHIIFRNEDNGYTVLEAVSEGEEITCVGSFRFINEGETMAFRGDYVEHAAYGRQFRVSEYEVKMPEDTQSIERYLGAGNIKGVGRALAARIVRHFGKETLRVMEEEPERLTEVKGISERIAREISAQMEEKADLRNVMLFLQQYGISVSMGAKLYKRYGVGVCGILKENPYRLADEVQGIGFKMADEIAGRTGIRTDSDYRIRSGLFYTLTQAASEGHMYLPESELMVRAAALLGLEPERMEKCLTDLAMERKVMLKEQDGEPSVYARRYYHVELDTARLLRELNIAEAEKDDTVSASIRAIEDETGIVLDGLQRKAVETAAGRGIFILTGGPGTGKTTTVNTMIRLFMREGLHIALAAPTGRAAKRMTETTGYEAQTIHRLLEVNGGVEESDQSRTAIQFERNAQNPLEYDVIIIDEMSMVDIFLMHSLLQAVTVGTRLILAGDVNQLPSVGPGQVLKDMIGSGAFSVVELTRIFRQAAESDIIVNAHRINGGESVPLDNQSRDFFFLKRYDADTIIRVMLTLVTKKLPKYVDAGMLDIQVLTPMRKGLLGVGRLNEILQAVLNPRSPEKRERETASGLFREGDKVMQIKNDYQLEWEIRDRYGIPVDKGMGVFNGDIGMVKEINTAAGLVTVEFDDKRCVEYSFKQLEELELAYAITIHKSQGSEYPAVIIPLLTGPRMLMNRNLLYTAVTRARKCVTLVGSEKVFGDMIANRTEQNRYTSLRRRIEELEGWETGSA